MEDRITYASVAFRKHGETYLGSVPMGDLALFPKDPAETMRAAAGVYQTALAEISRWQADAHALRQAKTPLPVRKAWELGDIIHRMNGGLAELGCLLENPYDHLEQHAGLPSRRISGFVTLRRYVPDAELIPEGLPWNRILKTVKSTGLAIAAGSYEAS